MFQELTSIKQHGYIPKNKPHQLNEPRHIIAVTTAKQTHLTLQTCIENL